MKFLVTAIVFLLPFSTAPNLRGRSRSARPVCASSGSYPVLVSKRRFKGVFELCRKQQHLYVYMETISVYIERRNVLPLTMLSSSRKPSSLTRCFGTKSWLNRLQSFDKKKPLSWDSMSDFVNISPTWKKYQKM